MPRIRLVGISLVLTLFFHSPRAVAGGAPCAADSTYQLLDFWTGEWQVFVGDTLVGSNKVLKVLAGCAVEEYWLDRNGQPGFSLFYVDPKSHRWRQVWVTAQATETGGLKEKAWLPTGEAGRIRFQGELSLPDGRIILDRTTLTRLTAGKVRQLIEISRDGGSTWRATFDAEYRPK